MLQELFMIIKAFSNLKLVTCVKLANKILRFRLKLHIYTYVAFLIHS